MKIWMLIFMILAAGMIFFNLFQIDWAKPFVGKSMIASIGVLAASCALLLLLVLQRSLLVAKKLKEK